MADEKHFSGDAPFFLEACKYVNDFNRTPVSPDQRCAMWFIAFNANNSGVTRLSLPALRDHLGLGDWSECLPTLELLSQNGILEYIHTDEPENVLCSFLAAHQPAGAYPATMLGEENDRR